MKKINKLLKLVPTVAIIGATVPLVTLVGCNNGGSTTKTYSISYGSTPDGLTFSSQPTSTKEKADITVSYTLTAGYSINTSGCSITCGSTDITSSCTIGPSELIVPASCVTGNISITLATTHSEVTTYTVTYNTPTGLTWKTTVRSVAKGSSILMKYTLSNGYAINESQCSITSAGTSIISSITWKSGEISIPANLITGNVVISLQTKTAATYTATCETATGLTWTSAPTSCTAGTNYEASYTLTDGYEIDTTNSTVVSGSTDITDHCTFGNGTLIVDGNYITGNLTVTLVTKTEQDTHAYTDLTGGTITSTPGTHNTIYTLAAGTSANAEMNITLSGTWLNSSLKIASAGTYNITLADGFKLSNKAVAVTTESYDADAPINITKAAEGAIVNFIIPDNAEATINDKRSGTATDDSDTFVIRHNDKTAAGQLNFKGGTSGGGVLNINNINNNKGWTAAKAIQSKVNMTISGGVTINAFSYDTCIQCGGKLTIDSANVIADSYYDDGIKTKFLDADDDLKFVSANPNSNRDIVIKGNSQVTVYADKNGINAAHNISTETNNGTPTINVYTNTQAKSAKSGSVNGTTTTTEQNMFVEVPSSLSTYCSENYFWTVDFYDANKSSITSTEYMTLKKIATTGGGQGGQSSTNYFLKCDRPLSTDASYFKINLYAKDQYGAGTMTATASSGYCQPYTTATSTSTYDCLAVSSISSSTISTSSTKFDRNYKATAKGETTETSIDTKVSSKGIKAKNNIALSSGTINIKSLDTSISCSYGDIYCKSATAGDITLGAGTIQVSGATVTTYSPTSSGDGIKAYGQMDITGGSINVTNAVEALEAPIINITGGQTVLYATDDGLNASTAGKYLTSGLSINMSGGILDVQTASDDTDCIDSNNTISITGGLLVSRIPSSGSSMTLDWESGNVSVTGTATVVLLGKTEADDGQGQQQKSLLNGGTDYTSYSSASTICATGNHTITYYSTSSAQGTDSYTYYNSSTKNSSKVRIWSCTGRATIQ